MRIGPVVALGLTLAGCATTYNPRPTPEDKPGSVGKKPR
jgi:hypothetical protein